jgi:hypothetical protein
VKFYVTFGVQYAHEKHPVIKDIHPDGVLLVEADDYLAARRLVQALLGRSWSMLDSEEDMEESWHHFPRGVTHKLVGLQIHSLRHVGGNAEDCPACAIDFPLNYPFICPGNKETTSG